jgi:hypothetical protein
VPIYEFEGSFVCNLREGEGVCFYLNTGDFYLGSWHQDKRHGFGVQFYKSGEHFEGTWANDCREGDDQCVLDSPDKTRYLGGFRQDQKHGSGLITKPDGTKIHEIWNMGELEKSEKVI